MTLQTAGKTAGTSSTRRTLPEVVWSDLGLFFALLLLLPLWLLILAYLAVTNHNKLRGEFQRPWWIE